jgi:LuxR family maltose regulon positive regulatory protein
MSSISQNNLSLTPHQKICKRPRISSILEQALQQYPITFVIGGTGYGKTCAVYELTQTLPQSVIWVQFSELDNSPIHFWENYIYSVSKVNQPFADALRQINFPNTDDDFQKYYHIMRKFSEGKKSITIADDLHWVTNPCVLNFIERATLSLHKDLSVILISNTTPKMNVPKLITEGSSFILTEDDLRFTENEISAYLKELGISVSTQNLRQIYNDTKGWAFSISLIGIMMQKSNAYASYTWSAAKNVIFNILETEVYSALSEPLRRLLIQISLVHNFSSDLINEICGNNSLLSEFKVYNPYIRYDIYTDAYIINHLFLEFLKSRQGELTEDEKLQTYSKAAKWCERSGYISDAFLYYEYTGSYADILHILYQTSQLLPLDLAVFVCSILERAPEETAAEFPSFASIHLRCLISQGKLSETIELALKYEENFLALPETPLTTHSLAGIYGTLAYARMLSSTFDHKYDFDLYFSQQAYYTAKNPVELIGPLFVQSVGAWSTMVSSSEPGMPDRFLEAIERSVPHAAYSMNGVMTGYDYLTKGELHFYRNELNEADDVFTKGLEKAKANNQGDIANRILWYIMRISFAQGDFSKASHTLANINDLLELLDYTSRYTAYDIIMGWYYASLHHPELVPEWLKGDFAPYTHPNSIENHGNMVKLRYRYAIRDYANLINYIEIPKQQILFENIGLKISKACCQYLTKDKAGAFATLSKAWALAEPNSIIMPFIELGKDMRTLTAAALRDGGCAIPADVLESLNRKSSAYAKHKNQVIEAYEKANNSGGTISLSPREKDVLTDLYHGLSRSEIASNRVISINTVKMVLRSLYTKLNANTAVDAIRIAVEHNLIV